MSRRKKGKRKPGWIETVPEPTKSKAPAVPLRPPGTSAPAGPAAARIQEIRAAIERGSSKAALEKAKVLHKEMPTDESKAVLIDAYLARIEAMSAKDLTAEAKALTDLVVSRFPEARDRLGGVQRDLAALTGDVTALVAPLADPDLSPEQRLECEQALRHGLVDVQALADCPALPEDHPLRTAAAAIARAFAAVTSGDVDDATVSLPEVSHRSPLADWKHLIRAIQCLYRGQDDECRRFLAALREDSAPARVADPIRAILAESADTELTHGGRLLVQRVLGPRGELRNALRALDEAFPKHHAKGYSRELNRQMHQTVLTCERAGPQIAKRLKQHITVKASMANYPIDAIMDAVGGPAAHDAYFWRLFARAVEGVTDFSHACFLWDRFRTTAIQEGLFAVDGQENAFLYLHMAELLRRISPEELPDVQENYRDELEEEWEDSYDEQESAPGRRRPPHVPEESDLYFLYPERLYERAAALRSDANIYKEWLDYTETAEQTDVKPDEVAQRWATALPEDARPLLRLAEAAEERNAFDKALKYIKQAEDLGGIDPKVRHARFRLLVARTVRHLKQAKPHLAVKDFEQLEQLPAAGEKDRPAFITSLRWVNAMVQDDRGQADQLHGQIQDALGGPVAAAILLLSTARGCQYVSAETNRLQNWLLKYKERDLVGAVIRTCPIGVDVNVEVMLPGNWESLLTKWFKRSDGDLDTHGLLTMAKAALTLDWRELAYYCSGYGLQRGGPEQARFLYLRGRSLPYSLDARRQDCFAAATALAKRMRDMDLVAEIADASRSTAGPWGWSNPFAPDWNDLGIDDETVRRVAEFEQKTRKYPKESRGSFFGFGRAEPQELCQCPDCRKARGETGGYAPAPGRGSRRRTRSAPPEDYLFDDLFDEESEEGFEETLPPMAPTPAQLDVVVAELMRLNGGKMPRSPKDLERLIGRHPELAIKLNEVFGGMPQPGLDPYDEFDLEDDEPWDPEGGPPRRPPGPRRRGRRKRKP